MKKLILIFILLVGVILVYKYKQNSFLGLSKPEMETESSLIEYAKNNNIYGEILVGKNKVGYNVLKKYFDFGNIYVLDNDLNLLDCNMESLGGRCFQDIQDDIFNNRKVEKREIKNITGKRIMDTLLYHSKIITNQQDSINFKMYDTIYIYTWVKYAKASVDKNSIQFMSALKNRNANALILTVNTDSLQIFK